MRKESKFKDLSEGEVANFCAGDPPTTAEERRDLRAKEQEDHKRRTSTEPKSASYIPMGEKLDCDDAVYRKKAISSWIIELIGGTERGGIIRMWKKANSSDIVEAETLPHIFDTTLDKKWALQDEVHFMHFENADWAYSNVKTVKDANDLSWQNR